MWRTELTADLAAELIAVCTTGARPERVALACRVLPEDLFEWLDRGASADAEDPFRAFACLWYQTESQLVVDALEDMRRGRMKDPKVAKTFLDDRFPDEYSGKAKPIHDALAAAMARPGKKDKVRAFIRKKDAEFFRLLLEEGALEALVALRDSAPPTGPAPAPSPKSVPEASETGPPSNE